MLSLRSSLETALVAERQSFSVLRSWLLVQLCSVHPFRWLNSSLEDWSQGTSYDAIGEKMLMVNASFGNGLNTSTVPTWQSECSRSHRRGQLVMIEVFRLR